MSTYNPPDFDSCDFSKLTVPHLKRLCKNRVTGYSKLAKSALVQKLEEHRQGQASTVHLPRAPSIPIVPSVVPVDAPPRIDISTKLPVEVPNDLPPSLLESVLNQQTTSRTGETGTTRQPETKPMWLDTLQQNPLAPVPLHERHQSSSSTSCSPNLTLLSAPIQKRSSQLLPDLEPSFRSPKRPKLLDTSGSNKLTPLNTAVFKAPALPQRQQVLTSIAVSLQSNNEAHQSDCVCPNPTQGLNAVPLSPSLDISKPVPKRFVPLTRKALVTKPGHPKDKTKDTCHIKDPFCVVERIPPMTMISIPPKLAQRKLVKSYAVILQGLSNAERRACAASNRLLRYAVYVSAQFLLSQFLGKRRERVYSTSQDAVTNLWPYLLMREEELRMLRSEYSKFFLIRFLPDPLSARLWTNPDDPRQVRIAMRFLLTCFWSVVSVHGEAGQHWLSPKVVDTRPIIGGEVWLIQTKSHTGSVQMLYVLEDTCEVIGHPPDSAPQPENALPLRADWSSYIETKLTSAECESERRLVDLLQCANSEDFDRGISKAWLQHLRTYECGDDAHLKYAVAQKYVLSSVVGNGVSGKRATQQRMRAEWSGNLDPIPSVESRAKPSINLFLPEHHHVEKVSFTSRNGQALHAAVACVQTPNREYFVLRENGMQVGCEEDGVVNLWMELLGCTASGGVVESVAVDTLA